MSLKEDGGSDYDDLQDDEQWRQNAEFMCKVRDLPDRSQLSSIECLPTSSFQMDSDSFSALSTELICVILNRLGTPQDLYSVISASPHVYRGAFTGSNEVILRNVVENSFNSTALPEALMAIRFLKSDDHSIDHHHDHSGG